MQEENTNTYIIDASYIISVLFPDETTDGKTRKLFEDFKKGKVDFLSTLLLPFEVLNSIKKAVTRKIFSEQSAESLTEIFLAYGIILKNTDCRQTLQIALEENLSVYDA